MGEKIDYSAITPEIEKYSSICLNDCIIQPDLYVKHKVNRGLRDLDGHGVLTGLTEISEINSKEIIDGSCGNHHAQRHDYKLFPKFECPQIMDKINN